MMIGSVASPLTLSVIYLDTVLLKIYWAKQSGIGEIKGIYSKVG